MGIKVTRVATAGEPLAGGSSLVADYPGPGDEVDVTTGLPLDNLLDVNAPTPADGDGIVWDNGAGEWVNTHALTESDVVALITPDIYTCDSLTVIASKGTIATGAHTDLHAVGGTTVNIAETATTPGFNVEAAFSGVDGLTNVYCHGYYTGNHTVTIDLYNYDTTSWDTVITFPTGAGAMTLHSAQLADGSPYFDGSGNAVARFYHASNGNPSHDLYLDYLSISHSAGGTGGLALNDLTDVDTTGKSDQDVLTWDLGTTTWVAAAAPSGSGIPATLLDAKGDLIVASAADTAARLAVGGTNGHVLTVDSGETLGMKWAAASGSGGDVVSGPSGSGTIIIPGLYGSPDIRVAGTSDDEFDTTDTSDPMTNWTTIGSPTAHDINSTVKSHYYVKRNAVAGDNMTGIYKAKSPTFTVTCKVADVTVPITNYMGVFLFIGEASPGKTETIEVNYIDGLKVGHYSRTSPTGSGTQRVSRVLADGVPIYLRWVVTSSSSVACYYSPGGQLWTPLNTAYNPGFTVGCAGVGLQPNNSTYNMEAIFDWVRFT